MPHPIEIRAEVIVPATPEQAWAAITHGPQVDSWFMGRTDIEPRLGGAARTDVGDFAINATVTAWEPGRRFRRETTADAEGRVIVLEYEIEGRDGQTVIRFVHSGFIGDDWEGEYSALLEGDPMYLRKLAAYLTYFAGRTAHHNHFLIGPLVPEREQAWQRLRSSLGLPEQVRLGDAVHAMLDGLPPIHGVVDDLTHDFLGVRTPDGLYRFMHDGTFSTATMVEHHDFADAPPPRATTEAWRAWLERTFAPATV